MSLKVLNFFADWATPCQELTPFIQKTIRDCLDSNPSVSIEYKGMNVDTEEASIEQFAVESVPTIVILDENNNILRKLEGFDPFKFKEALLSLAGIDFSRIPYVDQSNSAVEQENISQMENRNASGKPVEYHAQLPKAVSEKIHSLIHSAPVMLFIKGTPSKPQCGFTRELLNLLSLQNTTFNTFDILSDESVRSSLKIFSDWPTYPQVYVNGEFVGGLDIAKEMIQSGDWNQLFQ